MPRWKELPDELDPQVREFAELLRRVVDRAGLSLPALADRTGYSRTSWERYLNGRLLAPKGAVVALAEVTGSPSVHLTTLWELAERAWSRAELRQDAATEAIGIARARTPPGESGPPGRGAGAREGAAAVDRAGGRAGPTPGVAGPAGVSPTLPPGEGGSPGRGGGAHRLVLFLAGVMGVVVVVVGGFLLTGDGDPKEAVGAGREPSPSGSSPAVLPSGVLCAGAGCTGKDAEAMGCSGDLVVTARSASVGTAVVEVRYSRTCGAAWGRIVQAAPGDSVRVTVGAARQTGRISTAGDTIAYTPMIAVRDAAEAKACAVLASGEEGCTA
ncbi:helix-turn-helix domain-containing protein [Streptomyces phaeofaciens]|uniref:helix-turn-helix domain-containing protein n=1 Tax=Streptomyces phaeofaciens TaxID=68254 RepID=UPI00369695B7